MTSGRDRALAELAAPARPVVLIDGGSGSGKTVLAAELAARWPGPVQVVGLDDVYPGWDGLAAGSDAVRDMLRPRCPGYRRWNWAAGRPADWVELDPTVGLIVEGCGTLTPDNRARATAGIWVVAAPEVRHARAMARDGAVFAPHWEEWEAQERAHWRAHRPRELADWWFVDGGFVRHNGPAAPRATPP